MRKRKKIFSDHSGMTLVEVMATFFILILASKAVFSCISGYSRVIERSRELSAAADRLERTVGDEEHGTAAEIHLEINGEKFVTPGYYVKETASDSTCSVAGFWVDDAVMEELFSDEE